MSRFRAFLHRLAGLVGRNLRERDFQHELDSHLQLHIEENLRAGMSADRARREALMKLGGIEQTKERYRDRRGLPFLDVFLQDLRFSVRMLFKNPGFTLVALFTLALGIGGNTAVFSVMNTVLLRYLPLPNPQQLVFLRLPNEQPDGASNTGNGDTSFSEPVFEALRKEHAAFSDLMAYVPLAIGKVAVRIGEDPEEAEGDMVSGNFFSGLGVSFARGRGFSLEDETAHASVAVLSYSYWSTRFGRSPSAIGRTFYVKGIPFTIIGITAQGFYGIEPAASSDFWIPLQIRPELNAWGSPASQYTMYGSPRWWCIRLIARLAPHVTESQALAMIDPAFQTSAMIGLGTPDPKSRKPILAFGSTQGIQGTREDYEHPIRILLAMVGLVLAIACANVAMLLLARNSTRAREFSVRMALGASRGRLLRQMLTESFLLVAGGAALGWLFAISGSQSLAAWSGMEIPFSLDSHALLFTLAISIACAIVFGLAPLRSAVRVPVGLTLKTSNATAYRDKKSSWAGKVVVASQMALCLILLVACSLLVRSLRNYETLPLGLRADGLLVFGTSPLTTHNDAEKALFYQTLLSRLRVVPGVESVTLLENRLGSGWSDNNVFAIDGAVPQGPFSEIGMRSNDVGPDYCLALGIPILRGRDLADSDGRTAPKVVIINETFSKRFFPKNDPLGHAVGGTKPENMYTIVGVAADSKYTGVGETPRPMLYFPYAQRKSISDMQVELRTSGSPEALIPSVRAVLHDLDPNLPVQKPMTQRAQFDESFSQARLFARLSIFFGVIAVLLVATGLYGTLAYRVGRRTSEIGVRMALGAQRGQVLWMILSESLLITAFAILAGVPLTIGGARLMRFMLFGVQPGDVLSFALALFGVILVALAATAIPARRAAALEPTVALRYE
ncbi:MAG TPA: ABC transporter permease [Candidatus Methylomirabilis sp.]|nr:ABC transporter permease [Candidatus Methylomirabilis sp.]